MVNDGAGADAQLFKGDGAGNFGNRQLVTAGSGMGSVVSGDFDGDNKTDVAIGHRLGEQNLVFVALGGTQSVTPSTASTSPANITMGDFNEDGKLDLATSNVSDCTVSVLLGQGDGLFGPTNPNSPSAPRFASGRLPQGIVAGDFNGDGHLDLAGANRGDDTITLLLGSGRGGFISGGTLSTGRGPQRIAAGDLNGDGIADLAVTNVLSGTVRLYLSQQPLPPAPPGRIFVRTREATGDIGAYEIAVAALDDHPGDCAATSSGDDLTTDGKPVKGILELAGDIDHFAFEAVENHTYAVETQLLGLKDSLLTVSSNVTVQSLTNDDQPGSKASRVKLVAAASGKYCVRVSSPDPVGTGAYSVTVTESTGVGTIVIRTNLPEASFTLVSNDTLATRAGSGLQAMFEDLPPGMYTVQFGTISGYTTPASVGPLQLVSGDAVSVQGFYELPADDHPNLASEVEEPRDRLAVGSSVVGRIEV
ncbi:MAG: VCBS repeat-containing protein, partial [Candidatus Riflebacteria bacterium]|nr:VCBS repeat-containing protein [Candidatus Riflebacteria bacterium]